MKIYHNPRCRKSREGIEYLKEKKVKFEIIEYLKNNISEENIKSLLKKLGISAIDLVRKNESVWKENFKNKKLSENQIIKILQKEPKLIERPIIESNDAAVIGRPKVNIDKLI